MNRELLRLKQSQLEALAAHRDQLRLQPHLRWLFFEITNRCNLQCLHCGSSCTGLGEQLSVEAVERTLITVQNPKPMICLTGGEPLMHREFFEIARCVQRHGFEWGMTTNATLIDANVAHDLRGTGMSTVSVSLDGLEKSHDALRRQNGAWKRAVQGIRCLQDAGFQPQVTTVVHMGNFDELEPLYRFLCEMGIRSWRPINVEPIGRACESQNMLLSPDRFKELLDFIQNKRFDRQCPMEVAFGCSHYLGAIKERMVRDHYFLCGAGILVASVRSNGDICACLDIENRPELVQGNIQTDCFWDVWQHCFQTFREDRTMLSSQCSNCPERYVCGGDSSHTWDYDHNEPLYCSWKMINTTT